MLRRYFATYEYTEIVKGEPRDFVHQAFFEAADLNDAQINASLVAEADGKIIGFLMGTLCFGEFGIPETSAVVDTLGVDPDCQDRGAGGALFDQFRSNMKVAQMDKIYTLVDWKDFGLLKFLGNQGFVPSQRLSLECRVF